MIEFDAMEKDYGTIAEGDNLAFHFNIINAGGSELVISHLRSMCDCVEVTMEKTTIPPSKSVRLQGLFRSSGRWGKQEKLILVSSNAANMPEVSLKIRLAVASGIRVTPRSLSFGEIPRRSSSTKKVKIEARLKEELDIKNMKVRFATNVKARILRRKVSAIELPNGEKGYLSEIDIILKAENDSAGEFAGQLDIKTNSSKNPLLQILFSGENTGDLEISPAVVHFRNITSGRPAERIVTVKSLSNGPFRVTGLDAGDLPLLLRQLSDRSLEQQNIVLKFLTPEYPQRFYRGYIYILTDHSTQKKIKVGINAIVQTTKQ